MSSYELPATAAKPVTHAVIAVRRSLSTRWISLLTLVALLAIWWGGDRHRFDRTAVPATAVRRAAKRLVAGDHGLYGLHLCGNTWARASAVSAWAWASRC